MIKPLDTRILFLALAAISAPASFAGSYGGASGGSVDSTAQREIIRRQEDLMVAERLIQQGDRAMAAKDYETAYTSYMQAVDLIGSGPAVKSQRAEALGKFCKAGVAYAQQLIDNGRYSDAEKVAKTVLLPEYDPNCGAAMTLLAHLEQPDYYNKTVTPQFAEDREQVIKLLREADGFFASGRYDLATKRYEQVLNIDKYNIAARKGMEKVDNARGQYYREAYNETRSRMLWQVSKGWELPIRRFAHGKDTTGAVNRTQASRTEAITAKLNRIIIPKIDMSDTTIREAVDYLHQLSVKLDTVEPDPAKKGVNIFLKLSSASSGGAAAGLPGMGNEILPPTLPAAGGEAATPASTTPQPTEDTQITLALNNVPLYEALRYVASLAGLKIKIDPVAVSLVPLSDVSTELITKEYKVPPNFIPKKSAEAADSSSSTFGFGATTESSTPRIGKQMTAQEYLASLGVQFPEGASAQYIPSGSKLVVRNTQDNIDFIDQVVDSITGQAPTQVQIESKFVEINQNNLKELGFDWTLGAFSVGGGTYMAGGSPGADPTVYPFTQPGQTSAIGTNNITSGLRSGVGTAASNAISATSIDALLAGSTAGVAPGVFGLAGIFTNPQFQVVIRALNQKKGIDLMSAPTVTTKSGVKAVVNVIREFKYPTQFDPPQIPQTVNNGGGVGNGTGNGGFVVSPIITPTTPSGFETRNLGVTLDVTPQVGADGYTIDLDLAPEVVDFDGFINYGTPIRGIGASGMSVFAAPTSIIVSPNVINQPIFSTRKITTNVTIWDGMTISLGGLIREDVQKVQDKVPLLGDVPLVGRLFRSDVDQKIKKNLIIFVTAKLLDAEGKPVRSETEQEEIVEPIGLPDEIPPPAIEMKGPPAK
jgi:general secretion pathway protein D